MKRIALTISVAAGAVFSLGAGGAAAQTAQTQGDAKAGAQ